MANTLTAQEIREELARLQGWKRADQSILKDVELTDFDAAMRFVGKVADIAGREDHHPDIDIRWNKVRLVLSTHSAGGLTAKDFQVAALIDDIAT
ncbi:MAG TPA: 4a-hydroxytetrahydrobiopterin dehydratase [Patescibacteria group bacterium]|jgi:4a-hydroxytetrahydrobiopterin dehydratase